MKNRIIQHMFKFARNDDDDDLFSLWDTPSDTVSTTDDAISNNQSNNNDDIFNWDNVSVDDTKNTNETNDDWGNDSWDSNNWGDSSSTDDTINNTAIDNFTDSINDEVITESESKQESISLNIKDNAPLQAWNNAIDTKQQLVTAVHSIYKDNLNTLPKHTEFILTQNVNNYLTTFIKDECYPTFLKEQQQKIDKAKYVNINEQIKKYMLGHINADHQIHNMFINIFKKSFSSDYQTLYQKCKSFIENLCYIYIKQVKSFYDTHLWNKRKNVAPRKNKIQQFKQAFGEEYDLTTPEGRQKIYHRLQQERDKWQSRLRDLELKERQGKLNEQVLKELYDTYDKEYDKVAFTEPIEKEPEAEKVPFSERRKRGRPPKVKNNNQSVNTNKNIIQDDNSTNDDDWNSGLDAFASKNRIFKRVIYSMKKDQLYKFAIANINIYIDNLIKSEEYKKLESFCINRYSDNRNTLLVNKLTNLNAKSINAWLVQFLQQPEIMNKFNNGLQQLINEYLDNNNTIIKLLPNINTLSTLIKNLKLEMINNASDKGTKNTILRDAFKDYIKPIILQVFKEIAPQFIEEALEQKEEYTKKLLDEWRG